MARTGALSSAIMASGTLVSRILGFVKTILITVAIGTGTTMGTIFETANTLPNLIYVLVAGGIFNAVLVPQIIKASKHEDGGDDYISRLVTLAVSAMAVVTVVTVACSWPLIHTMGSKWDPAQQEMGVIFALWCLPQIFFYGLYTILGQVLNARDAFGWYMWTPVINNVVAIAALILFIFMFGSQDTSTFPARHDLANWTNTQTLVLAGSATLGVAIQALVLFWPLTRIGLKLRPKFGWRGIGLRDASKLAGWTLATGIISNLAFLYLTKVAAGVLGDAKDLINSGASVPGIQMLNYSSMLYSLPHGVIGLSIATMLFNRMAASHQDDDAHGVLNALSTGLRVASIATIFCAVALIVFAGPVGILFGGGDKVASAQIGQTLAIIALGGPFLTIAFMMMRIFYAQEDARTPFYIQVASAVVIVAFGFASSLLPSQYIIFGLAATYAVQNVLAVMLSHFVLKKRFGDYGGAEIVETHARVSLAAFTAGLVGAAALWILGGYSFDGFAWANKLTALITIAAGGIVMAIAYYVALNIFRVSELETLITPIRRKLGLRVAQHKA